MKNNLFHVLPPLYVQNKNGSRDYKPIPHLNLTFFAQWKPSETTGLVGGNSDSVGGNSDLL